MTQEAVRGDDGEVLDQIRLTGVRATGFHGVLPSERVEGQEFVVDVVVHLDTRSAAVGDDLARTVDYGLLAERVALTLQSDPADLIETVAERVAAIALAEQAVEAVDVVLHKPDAPITVPFDDVAVSIRRSRARMPVVVPVTELGEPGDAGDGAESLPLGQAPLEPDTQEVEPDTQEVEAEASAPHASVTAAAAATEPATYARDALASAAVLDGPSPIDLPLLDLLEIGSLAEPLSAGQDDLGALRDRTPSESDDTPTEAGQVPVASAAEPGDDEPVEDSLGDLPAIEGELGAHNLADQALAAQGLDDRSAIDRASADPESGEPSVADTSEPAGVLPTDAHPTDALPTDALPTDALPTDSAPVALGDPDEASSEPDAARPDVPASDAVAPNPAVPAARERDRMDEMPATDVDIVLALGANVGDTQQTLRDAIATLDLIGGIEVLDVSPLARTAPVGGPDQDDFLNAVVIARTSLSARELLHATQDVEHSFGRERTVRWGPRTLDIDLIVYGSLTDVADDLELPHPRAHERAFVLEPWSQVQPDAVLPGLGGGPVAQLAATAPDRSGIRWLALDWLGTEDQPAEPEPEPEPEPERELEPAPALPPAIPPTQPQPTPSPVQQPPVDAPVAAPAQPPVQQPPTQEAPAPAQAPPPADPTPTPPPFAQLAPMPVPSGQQPLAQPSAPSAPSGVRRHRTDPGRPTAVRPERHRRGDRPATAHLQAELLGGATVRRDSTGAMKRTRFALLVELAVGAAALGWLVLSFLESRAVYLPNVPWIVILALVALAGVVFWEGWLVRSYQRGRKPDLDALRAARAFVLGKAAALTGSLLVGWYASQFLVVLGDLSIDARRTKGVDALYAAAAALVLAVVGVVVERFCQLPPDDGNAAKDRARRPDPEADASS